jgi:hypothetical protein
LKDIWLIEIRSFRLLTHLLLVLWKIPKRDLEEIDIPIINNPFAEFRATYKPLQLTMAQRIGLDIPKTIMSNDPNLIRDF